MSEQDELMNEVKQYFLRYGSEYLFKSQTKEEIKEYYTKRYKNVSDFNVDDAGNVTFTCTIKIPDFPDNVNIELSEDFLARYNEIGNED
jgi:hypothetical protein